MTPETSGTLAKPYQRKQSEYATLYGKSLATIKRWCAKRLPLDDPQLMAEYISPRGRKASELERELTRGRKSGDGEVSDFEKEWPEALQCYLQELSDQLWCYRHDFVRWVQSLPAAEQEKQIFKAEILLRISVDVKRLAELEKVELDA